MKVAIFPGSFDPFTAGHYAIACRALAIFDRLVIGVGVNRSKTGLLTFDNRRCLIEDAFAKEPRVTVCLYESLTVEFCLQQQATHIVRGLRNSEDLEIERAIETLNKGLAPNIDTIYFLTGPEHLHISSSAVRELHHFGHNVQSLLPPKIKIDNYV